VILPAILVAALAAGAADVDETQFRYARTLVAPSGSPVSVEPDGPMYGHAGADFPDLRILDANGTQVPWRPMPAATPVPSQPVSLVARGTRDGVVSVVVDRGAVRPIIDRLELDVPDSVFVGSVEVQGSTTGAEGTYGSLSTTPIYSVRGAVAARNTTAVFPATDYRYLLVRARGVSQITGASVARDPFRPPLRSVQAESTQREEVTSTVVELDLGYTGVPVSRVRIVSSTPRYIRPVLVEGSNDGVTFVELGYREQVARFPGVDLSSVALAARHRYLRITIRNGDDPPLADVRVVPEVIPRPLLLAGGFEAPYRVLYGAEGVAAPVYDFARLPAAVTGFESARLGVLGAEAANELFEPPADTRTFFERNDYVIEVLLVVMTVVVAAGGVLALRRRTDVPEG
jgi:hypothetical protein